MRRYAQTIVVVLLLMLPVGLVQFPVNAQQNSDAVAKPTSRIESLPQVAPSLKVFSIAHADAAELIETIGPLFNIDSAGRVIAVSDKRTNTIIARGPDSELELLEVVLARLDEPTAKNK